MNFIKLSDINPNNIVSICAEAIEEYQILPVLQVIDEFAYVNWRMKYADVETFAKVYCKLTDKDTAIMYNLLEAYNNSGLFVEAAYDDQEQNEETILLLQCGNVKVECRFTLQSEYYDVPVLFELEMWINDSFCTHKLLGFQSIHTGNNWRFIGRLEQLLMQKPNKLNGAEIDRILDKIVSSQAGLSVKSWKDVTTQRKNFIHLDDHQLFRKGLKSATWKSFCNAI